MFVRGPFCKTETGGARTHTLECELRSCQQSARRLKLRLSCKQSARRLKYKLHRCRQSARSVLPSIALHNATTVLIKRRGKAHPAVRRGGRAEKGSVLPRKALERRGGRVAYSFFFVHCTVRHIKNCPRLYLRVSSLPRFPCQNAMRTLPTPPHKSRSLGRRDILLPLEPRSIPNTCAFARRYAAHRG